MVSSRSSVVLALALFLSSACAQPATPATPLVAPAASTPAPAARRSPVVFFLVAGGALAPFACFDGKTLLDADKSAACSALVPTGSTIAIGGAGDGTIRGELQAKCGRGEVMFDARAGEGAKLDTADWAVWPASARNLVTPDGGKLAATPDEQKALEKLLAEAEVDQPGPPNRRPTLAIHSGLAADIDGDGKADHVFAGHDASALFGLVAVFLAKSPGTPVILEARMNDYPALVGTTDLDGDGAREVWVGGAFLEWIEDSVLTSGTSTRLVQLAGGKARAVGSWGCRRF